MRASRQPMLTAIVAPHPSQKGQAISKRVYEKKKTNGSSRASTPRKGSKTAKILTLLRRDSGASSNSATRLVGKRTRFVVFEWHH